MIIICIYSNMLPPSREQSDGSDLVGHKEEL